MLRRAATTITTPIFYVNAAPHIGHAYTLVVADALARWQRNNGCDTKMITGTDEHGQKVWKAAASAGKAPIEYCNDVSASFRTLATRMNVKHDDFIRTTEPRHIKTVEDVWRRLEQSGDIYEAAYSGWYSVSDEAFVAEIDTEDVKLDDGKFYKVSTETGARLEWVSERNYMFRLKKHIPAIRQWMDQQLAPVTPPKFAKYARMILDTSVDNDLSISRPAERLHWGVPVPGDPSQRVYVWLDALCNYLACTRVPDKGTAEDSPFVHVVGKDIVKFHAVYWPAFLRSAGLPMPKQLLVHSHILSDGKKMSKSIGNVIDPLAEIELVGCEQFRYYLLKEMRLETDGLYIPERRDAIIRSDLSDSMGNLLMRVTSKKLNAEQKHAVFDRESLSRTGASHWAKLETLPDRVASSYEQGLIHEAISECMDAVRAANHLITVDEPWVAAKKLRKGTLGDHETRQLGALLTLCAETLRRVAIGLAPVLPQKTAQLLSHLGADPALNLSHAHAMLHPNDALAGKRFGGDVATPLFGQD